MQINHSQPLKTDQSNMFNQLVYKYQIKVLLPKKSVTEFLLDRLYLDRHFSDSLLGNLTLWKDGIKEWTYFSESWFKEKQIKKQKQKKQHTHKYPPPKKRTFQSTHTYSWVKPFNI